MVICCNENFSCVLLIQAPHLFHSPSPPLDLTRLSLWTNFWSLWALNKCSFVTLFSCWSHWRIKPIWHRLSSRFPLWEWTFSLRKQHSSSHIDPRTPNHIVTIAWRHTPIHHRVFLGMIMGIGGSANDFNVDLCLECFPRKWKRLVIVENLQEIEFQNRREWQEAAIAV